MEFIIRRTGGGIPFEGARQKFNPNVWVVEIDSLRGLLDLALQCGDDIIIKERRKLL
jgi:hypothetical protein